MTQGRRLEIRAGVDSAYSDVLTPEAVAALIALRPLDARRVELMRARLERRRGRQERKQRIEFLPADGRLAGTGLTVTDARAGRFAGSEIPPDLQRQWIQGTGPAAKPGATVEKSIRNVAYALLSGADGWMFDGEDALGQVSTMSLDNQRNLKLAIARAPLFLQVAEQVAGEMNAWARQFFGRPIVEDWRRQLDFTTRIFRARGLHLDDRHVRHEGGAGFSASIVDTVLYVVNNHKALRDAGASVALYLPKIQTAGEAALWNAILTDLEAHLAIPHGTIKVYVLVEQVEATFQLMEIRAALAPHFVGFNTGRWDYINSVADAMSWDPAFVNPNIADVTMTYGYMRRYEDWVRRAVNTPDANGRFALWQGGMEPNIPVGTEAGVANAMKRAVAGAEREQREGASGKWVAHWKMVHIIRPVWEKAAAANQLGRAFPPLGYTPDDADGLFAIEPAPRTVRGARDLISVAVQYRKRLRPGHAGRRLEAGRFVRQRRRPLPDGGHGDRRDSPEHRLGMAAQGRVVHRGRSRNRRPRRRSAHAAAVRPAVARGIREAAGGEPARRARAVQDDDAADRARDRRGLRDQRGQAAVVRRPAQSEPGQRRSRRSAATDCSVSRGLCKG